MPPADGGLDWRGRSQQKMEPGVKRNKEDDKPYEYNISINANIFLFIKKYDPDENPNKVIVKSNTSAKNLSQESELWLAGVWGLMRQLGGGGGRGRGRWSASVLHHQPVPHLLDGSLICDYGNQLEKDGQAYFTFLKYTFTQYFSKLFLLFQVVLKIKCCTEMCKMTREDTMG